MDKLTTRITRENGWLVNQQSYRVQYQINTKKWPWSKATKKWETSRSFDFNQYDPEAEDAALREASRWQWGIETTGNPDICEIINDASQNDPSA